MRRSRWAPHGAQHVAAHPPLPIDRWAAVINIDSLNVYGPARDIVLLGAERSTLGELAAVVAQRHDRVMGPDPEPGRGYFFRSDHFPLARAGVPALSVSDAIDFTGPGAADAERRRVEYNDTAYHQPADRLMPWWDLRGAVADLRLIADLIWAIASADDMPAYHPTDPFARVRQHRATPP